MGDRGSFALLLACFFLSGLTALIYQTAWTREFSFVFGATELAVTTVLAAYMGGLALGAGLAGRLAPRILRPVLVYALLELGIALSALLVPYALRAARSLYVSSFGGGAQALAESGGLNQTLFYLACSFAILLVPTTLMGATLPLLAGHAVRSESEVGSRIGALYSINTAGAVAGTLVAAFVLLPALGLRSTIWIAVALNGLVFLAAAGLARVSRGSGSSRSRDAQHVPKARGAMVLILPMILVSGVCSFVYEVMWVRLLGHLIGGSTYAFATMLASFLIGITLGASVAARIATNTRRAIIGFGIAQLGIAVLSLAAFSSIGWIAVVMREQLAVPEATGSIVMLTMITLLPAALCIGATFPFAVRIMARGSDDASSASARVYSWNTVGSIVGSILAGFVLLPVLHFAGTLELAVGLNLLLAAFSSLLLRTSESESATSSPPWIPRAIGGLGVVGLVLLIFLAPPEPWAVLLKTPIVSQPNSGRVIYYAVGRGATVLLVDETGRYRLRTNGLPESAIGLEGEATGRLVVATWLGNLPGLLRPEAESMLVVGLGGGVMIEHVPPTIKKISVVELEAEVVEANRIAASVRARDPLSDPRVSVTVNDARTALMISGREFDSIISQPSHPWTAGSSHLYTRDFFQLASDHLTQEGVFVQWMGMGFVDADLFRILVATLADVFPHVQVYAPGKNAFLFVGSKSPFEPLESAARAIALAQDHYELIGVTEPEDVLAALLLDDAGSRRFAEGAEISTDDFNILQTRSPNVRGRGISGLQHALEIVGQLDALQPPPEQVDALALIRRLSEKGRGFRAAPIAKSLPSVDDRKIADLLIALESPTPDSVARLRQLMREHPSNRELRAASLRLKFPSNRKPLASIPSLEEPLGPIEQRIVQASTLADEANWKALAAMDSQLAEVTPSNPNHRVAVQFRIAWRVARGKPADAREALEMLDRLVGGNADVRVLLRRTQLGDLAGDSGVVLSSTLAVLERAKGLSRSRLQTAKTRVSRVADAPPFREMRADTLAKIQSHLDQRSTAR